MRLSGAASQANVCDAILDSAAESLGAYAGAVLLLDDARVRLDHCASFGFDPAVMPRMDKVPLTADVPVTRAVLTEQPIYLEQPETWRVRFPDPLVADDRTQSAAALPLPGGDGRPFGVLTLAFGAPANFTGRIRMFMDSLAHECARALDRARLYDRARKAHADAEEANRAKDEFLATLSHELRTPLNAILGWAKLLRDDVLPTTGTHHALDTIIRNARLQARLVDELLDLSRIITGKLRLDVQDVHLAPIIGQVLDAMGPTAEARRITLRPLLDPEVGSVLGDPERLRQIIWNLVSNAVKFTPKNGAVDVKLERIASSALLSVADNGEGIDPEVLPFIFDRFRQGDSAPNRRHAGLGLGLSIVRHLVEAHGGSVRAESAGPGQGALFVVKLPLAAMRQAMPEPAVLSGGPSVPRLEGIRVLVVEDEADSRELTMRLLMSCGATVHAVGTAGEAFAAFFSERPDVMLADIGLPGEDGYSLIARIRAREAETGATRTPAAALTGYSAAEARKRAMLAGFNIHLAKPVEIGEIAAVLLSLLGRTGGGGGGTGGV